VFKKLIFLAILSVMLAGSVSDAALAGSVMEKDVIVVGTEGTYPPYEYYDDSNNLTGFDVDLVKKVAEKIGREVSVVDMAFDGLIPALLTGKIDVIAAALNATEERKVRVDFSDVYDIADAAILTKSDNDTLKTLDDLKGKVIGVQLGTVEDNFLSNLDIQFEVKRYQKTDDAVREVILNRNDCVLIGTLVANSYIDSDRFAGALKIAFRQDVCEPDEGFSFALRKNDSQFMDALNGAIKALEESGDIKELKKKYRMD
jgi:polar amino acid transport system substrate-binding protein